MNTAAMFPDPGGWWECPCGTVKPKRPNAPAPVRTVVSIRVPACPFCGRHYRPEYARSPHTNEPPAAE